MSAILFVIYFTSFFALYELMEHKLLLVPKLGREVNVIIVGIFKSLDLVPLHFKLLFAVRSDLIGRRTIIHALAV